jgi:hypothetical protein
VRLSSGARRKVIALVEGWATRACSPGYRWPTSRYLTGPLAGRLAVLRRKFPGGVRGTLRNRHLCDAIVKAYTDPLHNMMAVAALGKRYDISESAQKNLDDEFFNTRRINENYWVNMCLLVGSPGSANQQKQHDPMEED